MQKVLLLFFVCFFSINLINAQTWDGGGTTANWSDADNWSTNAVPVAGGAVIIPNGSNVTVDGDFSCTSVTFSGAAATLQVNSGFTLTVSGAITINHIAAGSNTTTISGNGSIIVGSVVIGSAAPFLSGSGSTRLNVSIQTLSCNGNISMNSYNDSPDNANAVFSLQSGTFNLFGTINPSVSSSTGQTASFLMNEGDQNGTLVLYNSAPWNGDADFNVSSGWGSTTSGKTYNLNLNGTNATVVYARTGAQTINRPRVGTSGTVAVTYRNLILSGSGDKQIASNSTATIAGKLSMQGTAAMITTSPIYGASSTLEYKGSSAQTTTGIEFLSGATAPLNLIVDNVNGVTLHSNRTLRTSAANTITLRNGVLNNGALNNISILTGSTIVRENGSFASAPNFPASVNLTYNQSLNPITSGLEVPVSTSVLNNLLIANTSGVTFNQDATVNGTWTLNSGIFTIEPGKTIAIASGNQIGGTGFSIIKHIITKANQTTGDIGFIRSGSFTGSRTFPLGEGNYYMPVTLNSAGTNDFNVAVFSGAALNGQPNGLQFTSTSPIVNANWIINRNTGSTPTDITFSWSESLEGGAFSAAADNQIGISRYDGSAWDPIVGIDGDNSANTVTRTGVNNFSPFIVAVLGTPLPLKFGNISAARNGQAVNVNWEALSEENVAYYDVEKSYTGRSFSKAGVVNAIANNSTSFKYSWIDAVPGNGTVFYRIKAVDNDGKYQYSSIVKVAPENGTRGLTIYPNPVQANGRFNIEAGSLPRGTYMVELINMTGVRSFTRLIEHTGGSLTQNMELSKSLKPGTYILKFSGENVSYTSTVILK